MPFRNAQRQPAEPSGTQELSVSWRAVSIASAIVALAAVMALVVVAAVNDADALATVALALAVLAFAGQLASSIVQGQAANQLMLQSERLNNETQALLTKVTTSTDHVRGTIESQFDTVLRHALGEAVPTAVEESRTTEGIDSEALSAVLGREMERIFHTLSRVYLTEKAWQDHIGPSRSASDAAPLEVGDEVVHERFGAGVVSSIEDGEALIDFEQPHGQRRLLLAYEPMRRVDDPSGRGDPDV